MNEIASTTENSVRNSTTASSETENESDSENDNPSDSPLENQQEHNFFHKIITLFGFGKPGTKKDLDQEIQELLVEGEEHGLISSLEEKMISSILEFRDTCASEIMTPAAEIVSCETTLAIEDLIKIVIESGFTRIPIYQESLDNIIGIIHAKDLLCFAVSTSDEERHIKNILRPTNFALEERPIIDIFREFQRTKVHIAIIHDEFGAVRGLITLEDILEEIVGEIDDEYDDDDDEQTLEIMPDGSVAVHGWVDTEKLEEHFGIEFEDGPFESVGGLIVHKLGRLAQLGDIVEINDLRFEVLIASQRKIDRIRVARSQPSRIITETPS